MTLKSRPTNGYKASRKIRVRIQTYVVTLLESSSSNQYNAFAIVFAQSQDYMNTSQF